MSETSSLIAAIEGNYDNMSHSDLVLTCQMLVRGRNKWREIAESQGIGCTLAGPGRGDCAHFIGLPGKPIPGQHDGSDVTVDCYGKPNGWCWSCWKDYRITQLEKRVRELEHFLLL